MMRRSRKIERRVLQFKSLAAISHAAANGVPCAVRALTFPEIPKTQSRAIDDRRAHEPRGECQESYEAVPPFDLFV